jgi:uncharacterized membrane protein
MHWITAGVVLGVGLGGFADGIALHQIAQWHNMGSAIVPPDSMDAMRLNMRWDGLFHLGTWLITLIGIFMLWMEARLARVPPSASAFSGQLVFGWGVFNVTEGVIDHHLLQLHHVRDLPVHMPMYDWVFLAVCGLGFIALGLMLMTPASHRAVA